MRSSFDFVKLFSAFLALILLCSIPAVSLAKEGSSIVLTFTGDCTLGNEERLNYQPYSFVGVVKEQGFDYPFAKVKELFESDDLTIINLENVFCDTCNGKASKTYNFKSPTSFAEILPKGSVELAFIGNNHILDYGSQGLNSTLKALKDQGVPWFGSVYDNPFHYIYEKDGVKIGFFGTLPTYFMLHRDEAAATMATLKEAGCEVIIGVMHAGTEYSGMRDRMQVRMANWMVKNGADLVIGHHPHIPQGMDILGHASVLYSLGNFSFGGNHKMTVSRRGNMRADKALIARVELKFDADKKYLGHQVNLIPVSPSGEYDTNNYQPVLLTGEDAEKTMQMVQRDTPFELKPYVEGVGALQDFVKNTRDDIADMTE
ncbi:MAG: CapA family protein [Christensenellales bacterium]|jgi:poly-gamma-glutamate synthesis protein (capsule biosynthesis protein)|nr:CapA family protein [Clostridiales bacterium]